jgi:hypothetical protein
MNITIRMQNKNPTINNNADKWEVYQLWEHFLTEKREECDKAVL